jgi:hypothetical protein
MFDLPKPGAARPGQAEPAPTRLGRVAVAEQDRRLLASGNLRHWIACKQHMLANPQGGSFSLRDEWVVEAVRECLNKAGFTSRLTP